MEEVKSLRNEFSEWCHSSSSKPSREERLIGIEEAAAILNRSVETIYKWVRQGKIPFYKPGKMLEFSPSELRAYRSNCKKDRTKTTGQLLTEMSAGIRRKPKSFGNPGI